MAKVVKLPTGSSFISSTYVIGLSLSCFPYKCSMKIFTFASLSEFLDRLTKNDREVQVLRGNRKKFSLTLSPMALLPALIRRPQVRLDLKKERYLQTNNDFDDVSQIRSDLEPSVVGHCSTTFSPPSLPSFLVKTALSCSYDHGFYCSNLVQVGLTQFSLPHYVYVSVVAKQSSERSHSVTYSIQYVHFVQ